MMKNVTTNTPEAIGPYELWLQGLKAAKLKYKLDREDIQYREDQKTLEDLAINRLWGLIVDSENYLSKIEDPRLREKGKQIAQLAADMLIVWDRKWLLPIIFKAVTFRVETAYDRAMDMDIPEVDIFSSHMDRVDDIQRYLEPWDEGI